MLFRYPINDVHIHVFDPGDIDACIEMTRWCGYTHWTHLACTVVPHPLAVVQNLIGALLKLREGGRCQAFASFHYGEGLCLPEADELARQIEAFDKMGFDGIKMLDGKPGLRRMLGKPLDAENYDAMFDYAERTQFPILYHIGDPIEFWTRELLPEWAVRQGLYYDATYPHKYVIEKEALTILHKHPRLNLCIPHFFFISDQPGLCAELLEQYPNLYFDITPGWEMFENFAKNRPFWRTFFKEHSDKILFGTDTFSDHWKETVTSLQRVLETDETFTAFEENCVGLDLDEQTLRDLYFNNYFAFIRSVEKKIDVDRVLAYADTLYDKVPDGESKESVCRTIDELKIKIARYRSAV